MQTEGTDMKIFHYLLTVERPEEIQIEARSREEADRIFVSMTIHEPKYRLDDVQESQVIDVYVHHTRKA